MKTHTLGQKQLRPEPSVATALRAPAPGASVKDVIVRLQRGVGNQAVARWLHPSPDSGPPETDVPSLAWESVRSRGQGLDPATRDFMEERLGHDLSHVRVHADATAEKSAEALDARAFAIGQHVVFGAGHYAPSTQAGRALLAHELTHTIQQRGVPTATAENLVLGPTGTNLEHEADAAAAAVGQGFDVPSPLPMSQAAAPIVQRQHLHSVEIRTIPPQEQVALPPGAQLRLPEVGKEAADPRTDRNYVDNRVKAAGYSIWLFGYNLYFEGVDRPIHVPWPLVNFGLNRASRVSSVVFPDYDSAVKAVPYGPWREGDSVPYASLPSRRWRIRGAANRADGVFAGDGANHNGIHAGRSARGCGLCDGTVGERGSWDRHGRSHAGPRADGAGARETPRRQRQGA